MAAWALGEIENSSAAEPLIKALMRIKKSDRRQEKPF
ncbi:hypothetical protein [Nostoc sp.]